MSRLLYTEGDSLVAAWPQSIVTGLENAYDGMDLWQYLTVDSNISAELLASAQVNYFQKKVMPYLCASTLIFQQRKAWVATKSGVTQWLENPWGSLIWFDLWKFLPPSVFLISIFIRSFFLFNYSQPDLSQLYQLYPSPEGLQRPPWVMCSFLIW